MKRKEANLFNTAGMLRNSSFLISEYLVQTKKKWFASSWGAPQLHAGLDKI
jgi:hypothetical protein